MIKQAFILFFLFTGATVFSQVLKTRNIILVTLDGFRWQELFNGADSAILYNKKYVKDQKVIANFWDSDPQVRRQLLLPFFWNEIGSSGQLYGNRGHKNFVVSTNPHLFSYPGYSELLVGFVDKRIKGNDNIENPNYTVLDFIHRQPGFEGKVAAFATWEAFSYIIRENTGGIPVNAGSEASTGEISEREELINELQDLMPNPHGARYDAFTFYQGFEYLKRARPRVMFLAFDETDEHGHHGRYDEYLKSAHKTDKMLAKLWNWIQSQEDYRDQTTLIITTDHGRGKGSRKSWKDHGLLAFGSGQIWMAVMGPDTPSMGEMKTETRLLQKQIAATMAAFLGLTYTNEKEVGEAISSVFIDGTMADAENVPSK